MIKGESVSFAQLTGKGQKSRNMPQCAGVCELLNRCVKYLEDYAMQFELMDRSKSPTFVLLNTWISSRMDHESFSPGGKFFLVSLYLQYYIHTNS